MLEHRQRKTNTHINKYKAHNTSVQPNRTFSDKFYKNDTIFQTLKCVLRAYFSLKWASSNKCEMCAFIESSRILSTTHKLCNDKITTRFCSFLYNINSSIIRAHSAGNHACNSGAIYNHIYMCSIANTSSSSYRTKFHRRQWPSLGLHSGATCIRSRSDYGITARSS